MTTTLTYSQWINIGTQQGWCGPAVCYTHDGMPTTEAEDEEFQEGDPCIHILRLYENEDMKREIEENHSPSNWRKA